jgi:hypothetical protein
MQERVIIASRWKTLMTLPLALVAAGLGWWALMQHAGLALSLTGWVAIFCGAAAIPVLMLQVIRPPRLRLRPDVMIFDTGLNQKIVPWSDIEGFYLWRMSAAKFPALRYKAGRMPDDRMTRVMHDRAGVDQTIAAPWPMAPEAMVNVLNQARRELCGEPAFH